MILECSVPKNQTNAPFPSSTIVLWQTKAPFPTNGFSLLFVHEISLSLFEANLFSPHQESFQQHFTPTNYRWPRLAVQKQGNLKPKADKSESCTESQTLHNSWRILYKRLQIQSGITNWRSVFVVWGPGYQNRYHFKRVFGSVKRVDSKFRN